MQITTGRNLTRATTAIHILTRLASESLTGIGVIWLVGLMAYWPALSGPWLLDDIKLLAEIGKLHAGGLATLFSSDWASYLFLESSGIGRPLSMATLAANALFDDQPFTFKAVNLLLHLLTGSLILLLVRLLARRYWPAQSAAALALVVALAWTLHPLQVSTVAYAVQRMTILSAMVSVLALWLYARLRMREFATDTPARLIAWVVPLLALPALAVLAKENGALLPGMLVLLEVTVFHFRGSQPSRRWLMAWSTAVVVVALSVALWVLVDPPTASYAGRPFDLTERFLTEARVVSMYVGQILFPRIGAMPFFYDALPHSIGWLTPASTLAGGLFLAGLLGLGFALSARRPLAAFGILFFFVGHLMESTFWPLELAFEHRNYLPSLGLILAAADLTAVVTGAVPRLRPAIAVLAILLLGALTFLRALTWSDPLAIYINALASPWPSQRARAELAQVLTDRGQLSEARYLLAQARGLGPRLHEGWLDCMAEGVLPTDRIVAAEREMSVNLVDYDINALVRVINLALDDACSIPQSELLSLTTQAATRAALQPPQRYLLWLYVGHLRHQKQDMSGAMMALEEAFAADQRKPLPLLLAAEWQLDVGNRSDAQRLYDRARALRFDWRLDFNPYFDEIAARLDGSGAGN